MEMRAADGGVHSAKRLRNVLGPIRMILGPGGVGRRLAQPLK
jgi:hypothetical protein